MCLPKPTLPLMSYCYFMFFRCVCVCVCVCVRVVSDSTYCYLFCACVCECVSWDFVCVCGSVVWNIYIYIGLFKSLSYMWYEARSIGPSLRIHRQTYFKRVSGSVLLRLWVCARSLRLFASAYVCARVWICVCVQS